MRGFDRLKKRPVRRLGIATLAFGGVLLMAGVAAATQGGSGMTRQAASVRSIVHILGMVTSLLLASYGYQARERFKGGVLGSAASAVIVGALMFAVAFLVEELDHGFGINIFNPVGDMQLQMALSMILFTGTVFAFGWAFYTISDELRVWYT